jgi:hypothetical protein
MTAIAQFGSDLTSAISPSPGSPIVDVNVAGNNLSNTIENLMNKLEKIVSQQNYTS